jgi:hypothetical protein
MCCYRNNEEYEQAMLQQRQNQAVEDLAAAIENAELPEVKGVTVEGKKNDGSTPGFRQTRTNG